MELTPIANEILFLSNFLVYLISRLTTNNHYKSILYLLFLSQTLSFIIYDKDEINPYLAIISFINGLYLLYNIESRKLINSEENKIDLFFNNSSLKHRYHTLTLTIMALIILYDILIGDISDIGYFLSVLSFIILFNFYSSEKIKSQFSDELEFLFFFFLALTSLFLISSLIDLFLDDIFLFSTILDRELSVEVFLSKPLVFVLKLLGIHSWYDGQIVYYPDQTTNLISQVHITKDCSGLDSVVIFSSACYSFVYVS